MEQCGALDLEAGVTVEGDAGCKSRDEETRMKDVVVM
jgi:hypothetical protein